MPASYETHRRQLELILNAWGMAPPTAASTAEIMSWADLHGIDTHGISMVPVYDERRRGGKIDMTAEPVVSRETPVSALVDGQRRPRPRQRPARHGSCHRQGQDLGHRRRRGAQFGAFRRLRLLCADGGRGRPDRHGRDVRKRHPGRARPSAPRRGSAPTRSPSPRRAGRASRSCSTWRPPPSPPEKSATRPTRICRRRPAGWSPPKASPAPIRAR